MRMTGGVNWRSFAPDYELDVNRKPWALSLKWRRTNLLLYLTILSIVGGIVPTVLLFDEIVEFFDRLVGPDVGSNAGLIVTLIIIVLVSGGLLVFGFGGLRWRLTIRIDDDQVTVRDRLYWRWSGFSEPLTNYRGVESRSERHSVRGGGIYTLQFIELVHADPTRTVPLLRREQEDVLRSEWEAYAKAFGLPTLHLDTASSRRSPGIRAPRTGGRPRTAGSISRSVWAAPSPVGVRTWPSSTIRPVHIGVHRIAAVKWYGRNPMPPRSRPCVRAVFPPPGLLLAA